MALSRNYVLPQLNLSIKKGASAPFLIPKLFNPCKTIERL